jgi:hypothetical protein
LAKIAKNRDHNIDPPQVLCNAWNDPNRAEERPDMSAVKDKVHRLVWRDAHQLFLRLEAGAAKLYKYSPGLPDFS